MLSINVTTHGVRSLFCVAIKSPSTPTSTTTVSSRKLEISSPPAAAYPRPTRNGACSPPNHPWQSLPYSLLQNRSSSDINNNNRSSRKPETSTPPTASSCPVVNGACSRPISRIPHLLYKIIHPPTSTTTVNHPAMLRHQHLPRLGLIQRKMVHDPRPISHTPPPYMLLAASTKLCPMGWRHCFHIGWTSCVPPP